MNGMEPAMRMTKIFGTRFKIHRKKAILESIMKMEMMGYSI